MLRRLSRLLIVALLLAVVAFVASKLMGGSDDDFDDFDDLDSGFDFQETPVEIDVPASEPATPNLDTARLSDLPDASGKMGETSGSPAVSDFRLIDINGIGHAYEARLQAIGVNSVSDLASADAESLASQIDVIGGAATISDWISQARSHPTSGQ